MTGHETKKRLCPIFYIELQMIFKNNKMYSEKMTTKLPEKFLLYFFDSFMQSQYRAHSLRVIYYLEKEIIMQRGSIVNYYLIDQKKHHPFYRVPI